MSANRVFVPGALLDAWVSAGRVDVQGAELRVRDGEGRLALEEAALVLREVTGGGDTLGLVGRVRPVGELVRLGAEILDRSMVLGDRAYDIEPGFLAEPLGVAGGRVDASGLLSALSALSERPAKSQSDEELLARYLIEKL
jgi:hypothetical protein